MKIALGALAPSLTEQLAGMIDEKELSVLDADANAITRLYIRGYMSSSQVEVSRKRLVKNIDKELTNAAIEGVNK